MAEIPESVLVVAEPAVVSAEIVLDAEAAPTVPAWSYASLIL